MQNPFQYGKVVSDPYFTDREAELELLIQEVNAKHNLVLYSPRRYGKTSLLLRLAMHMEQLGRRVIYVDFYRITSQAGFIEQYTREVFSQSGRKWKSTLKKMGQLLKGIRPVVSFDATGSISYSISLEAGGVSSEQLESVLNLSESIDPDSEWLIIFDEFQEISKLNGDSFEKTLRATIQHHQRCSYIFSGSRYHLLLDIFNNRSRAFYQFGKIIQLEKIPPEIMAAYVAQRFKDTGIILDAELAQAIVAVSGNIPNYVQFLASEVWLLASCAGSTPDQAMLEKATGIMLQNLNDYFYQTWNDLSLQQKKVLMAFSKEAANIFSQDYHQRHHLNSISATQVAVKKLCTDQIIMKSGSEYEFCDPFFKLYLQRQ